MNRRLLVILGVGLTSLALLCAIGTGALLWLFWQRPAEEQLLLVGGDARLRLLDTHENLRVLAEDASADPFRYPVPAPDGQRLAYISADGAGGALHILGLSDGSRRTLYESAANPPLYLTWSPDGRYLSFLVNVAGGGLHTYVVATDGSGESELISPASPSYFAWSPDSSTLLLHQGGSGVEGGRVLTYRPGETARVVLSDPGFFFRTVSWSLDGSRLLYVAQPPVTGQMSEEQIESVITRAAPDGSSVEALIREPRALLFFLRAPNHDGIAYLKLSAEERGLYLWDGTSATPRRLSRDDDDVTEFFWAPDGRQIAYLTLEPTPSSNPTRNRRWHVVDVASGTLRDFETFTPSTQFEAMLQFFDAYALAFSIWSGDSQRLVYGAADGVFVLDTASGQVSRAGEGTLGMWIRGP